MLVYCWLCSVYPVDCWLCSVGVPPRERTVARGCRGFFSVHRSASIVARRLEVILYTHTRSVGATHRIVASEFRVYYSSQDSTHGKTAYHEPYLHAHAHLHVTERLYKVFTRATPRARAAVQCNLSLGHTQLSHAFVLYSLYSV